ncbi:hypothetical protein BS17DRAFT_783605 [Gyrodon lividus]|nr:hypothetical protein BS17DRAFT_783605 [Gyrodon lividus]
MMISLMQASVHHAGITTDGNAPQVGVTTAASSHQCAWLVDGRRCGEQFFTLQDLVIHLGGTHDARGSAERLLMCEWDTGHGVCRATFRRDNLKRHIESHFDIKHLCDDCGKVYSRPDTLKNHVKRHHPQAVVTL